MNIILSRKGIDSAAGGRASLIMPSNDLIWIPIPSNKMTTVTNYGMIQTKFGNLGNFATTLKLKCNKTKVALGPNSNAHLDPDLDPASLSPRHPGWIPAIGQRTASAVRLLDAYVKPLDLFLFYGWFRDACGPDLQPRTLKGKDYYYAPKSRNLHVIFGYLQVREIYQGEEIEELKAKYPALSSHPHLNAPYVSVQEKQNDRVYIATERLQINRLKKSLPGAGVFSFDQKRCLKKCGEHRCSHWRLTGWAKNNFPQPVFHRDSGSFIGWSSNGEDWDVINHGFGQEFVLDTTKNQNALDWVIQLF
jgi:hypothetical protein